MSNVGFWTSFRKELSSVACVALARCASTGDQQLPQKVTPHRPKPCADHKLAEGDCAASQVKIGKNLNTASSHRCHFVRDAPSVLLSCTSRQKIGYFRASGTAVKPPHSIMLNSGLRTHTSQQQPTNFTLGAFHGSEGF